jgi:hypothetical protein
MSIQSLPVATGHDPHDMTRLAFMLKLADTLQSMPDVFAIQEAACRLLAEHLQVEHAYYAEISGDRQIVAIRSEYTREKSRSLPGSSSICSRTALIRSIKGGQPFICDDAATAGLIDENEKAFYHSHHIRSCMAFPVVSTNQISGYIAVADGAPHQWTASDVSLFHETAIRTREAMDRIGKAERINTEREIMRPQNSITHKTTDKYRAILNAIDDGFAFCELVRDDKGRAVDFRYLDSNAAFAKIHPNPDPWWITAYEKVVNTGEPVRAERFFDNRWYDVGIYPFGDNCFSVIFRDINRYMMTLTTITAYGKTLQRQLEEIQDERACLMQNLNAQMSRLHRLIHDLLDAKMGEGSEFSFTLPG